MRFGHHHVASSVAIPQFLTAKRKINALPKHSPPANCPCTDSQDCCYSGRRSTLRGHRHQCVSSKCNFAGIEDCIETPPPDLRTQFDALRTRVVWLLCSKF
eukprot:5578101-Pyramimonas_sp.AAC.2